MSWTILLYYIEYLSQSFLYSKMNQLRHQPTEITDARSVGQRNAHHLHRSAEHGAQHTECDARSHRRFAAVATDRGLLRQTRSAGGGGEGRTQRSAEAGKHSNVTLFLAHSFSVLDFYLFLTNKKPQQLCFSVGWTFCRISSAVFNFEFVDQLYVD